MLKWFAENLATILITLFLLLGVGAIVLYLVRQKRRGSNACGCGGGCSHCGMAQSCHPAKPKPKSGGRG